MKIIGQFVFSFYFLLISFDVSVATTGLSGINPPEKNLGGIINFKREHFLADPQFWSVTEDSNGIMYFGNNDGAVVFDGERWHKVILPNNSSIRCLVKHTNNIYAGGFNEIGLIKKDEFGNYFYESLIEKLQLKSNNLGNIWQVHEVDDYVIFRSYNTLIVISENLKVVNISAETSFSRSYVVDGKYYVQEKDKGIFALDLDKIQLRKTFSHENFHDELVEIFSTDKPEELLGASWSGRLYILNKETSEVQFLNHVFEEKIHDQVLCGVQSKGGQYYLGTLSSRIITLDKNKKVTKGNYNFQNIQEKTILNLFLNSKGNLWVLLNNGIDYINFQNPITRIFDNASIYDVAVHQNKTFIATNQGVYYADSSRNWSELANHHFQKVDNMEGQVWSLQKYKGDLLIAHDKGLFKIDGLISSQIGNFGGVWKVIPVKGKENLFFASTYEGLYLIKSESSGKWNYVRKISGFNESARDILPTEIEGTYWVCHGYKGVYRIKIDEGLTRVVAIEHYTNQNGLTSPFNVNVFNWEGNIVFTTNTGIYTFNDEKNLFVPFERLNHIFDPQKNTRQLLQFDDKTWFVEDDEVGYFFTKENSSYKEKDFFLQLKGMFNRGMECIIPLENQQVLFGTMTGLFHYNLHYQSNKKLVPTFITGIKYATGQEENQLPLISKNNQYTKLPNNTNLLRFDFSAPDMKSYASIQYSHMLENIDDEWSNWQKNPYKEFNYLRPGRYTFKVRSRSLSGAHGSESSYQFEILPVWYQTTFAWILYFIFSLVFIVALFLLIRKKIENERNKTRAEEQQARKMLELELQQLKLHSEKEKIEQDKELLEEDVIYKSKELANYTMLLVKKREIFSELRDHLKDLKEYVKNEVSRNKVRGMIHKITQHMNDEEYLHVFDANFEKVHHEFFSKLKEQYPDLSQKELRLCAFVKMNLSNKEVAPMLNISVRGVETARYRLRKKLNLDHENNLVEFLEKLYPSYEEEIDGNDKVIST